MNKRIFMTIDQACELWGIERTKFYKLAKRDPEFPHIYKEGRYVRLVKSDCKGYLDLMTNRILAGEAKW